MKQALGASYSHTVPFPRKLYDLIADEPDYLVEWLPHGNSFVVRDQELFCSQVLPKYFRHTKLTSFQRQLNLYGFRRITKGPDTGAYCHPEFKRDYPENLAGIKRVVRKGPTSEPQQRSSAPEPDYDYPQWHTTAESRARKSREARRAARERASQKDEARNEGFTGVATSPTSPHGFPELSQSERGGHGPQAEGRHEDQDQMEMDEDVTQDVHPSHPRPPHPDASHPMQDMQHVQTQNAQHMAMGPPQPVAIPHSQQQHGYHHSQRGGYSGYPGYQHQSALSSWTATSTFDRAGGGAPGTFDDHKPSLKRALSSSAPTGGIRDKLRYDAQWQGPADSWFDDDGGDADIMMDQEAGDRDDAILRCPSEVCIPQPNPADNFIRTASDIARNTHLMAESGDPLGLGSSMASIDGWEFPNLDDLDDFDFEATFTQGLST